MKINTGAGRTSQNPRQLNKMIFKKMMDMILRKNIKVRVQVNPTVPKYDDEYVMIDTKEKSCS